SAALPGRSHGQTYGRPGRACSPRSLPASGQFHRPCSLATPLTGGADRAAPAHPERLPEMHLSPEAHGPVERSRRFGAPPRLLLESCHVTPAPGRPGRDTARRLPPGCPYAQQARAPASGSRRVRRHNQRNAARAQFWLGAEFVALQLRRSFSLCAVLRTTVRSRPPIGPWAHSHSAAQVGALTRDHNAVRSARYLCRLLHSLLGHRVERLGSMSDRPVALSLGNTC